MSDAFKAENLRPLIDPTPGYEPTVADLDGLTGLGADKPMLYARTPEAIQQDNTRRAAYAIAAVVAYSKATDQYATESASQVTADMIGDIMHLCDAMQIDFQTVLSIGRSQYADETDG